MPGFRRLGAVVIHLFEHLEDVLSFHVVEAHDLGFLPFSTFCSVSSLGRALG